MQRANGIRVSLEKETKGGSGGGSFGGISRKNLFWVELAGEGVFWVIFGLGLRSTR